MQILDFLKELKTMDEDKYETLFDKPDWEVFIMAYGDDISYTIDRIYAYRPDLLAYDLYGSSRLWWVFAQRNPNELEDPIYDFAPGITIQIPKLSNLQNDLGI